MRPVTRKIEIYQGDTFVFYFRIRTKVYDEQVLAWIPSNYLDLTGSTVLAQVRASVASSVVLATFSATLTNQTTTPGGITLTLTPTQTSALPSTGGVWDVQVTNGSGVVRTYINGEVAVLQEVSRV